MNENWLAGQLVEFFGKDRELTFGIILGSSAKGLRVLMLNKRETTIVERSVVHVTIAIKAQPSDFDKCLSVAETIDKRRAFLAEKIDLEEVHKLLSEEPKAYSVDEISEFLIDQPDEDFIAALLRRLHGHTLYFRPRKEGFFPVPRAEVEAARIREERRIIQEKEDKELIEEIKAAQAEPRTYNGNRLVSIIDSLVFLSVHGKDATDSNSQKIWDILLKANIGTERKLFSFLVQLGVFKPDENLLLRKYKVPIGFPDNVVAESMNLFSTPQTSNSRKDLRELRVWVIDSEGTKDRDDGFSIFREPDGKFTLWVHITDIAHWIPCESLLDHEIQRRCTSIYMPDENIPMLPRHLSETHLSLQQGREHFALSAWIRFDEHGQVLDHQFFESLIHVNIATDYYSADEMIPIEPELADACLLSQLLRENRRSSGAIIMERPQIEFFIDGQEIKIRSHEKPSPTQEMVSEFMIWTNHLAAKWCKTNAIPAIFRTQEASSEPVSLPARFEPLAYFRNRHAFKKTLVSTDPGIHWCLGVNPYCQVTSPIRRFGDLIIQRQIKAFLSNRPLPYDKQTLTNSLLLSNEALTIANHIMDNRQRYYLLKYLKQEQLSGKEIFNAIILDSQSSEIQIYIEEICLFSHCRKPAIQIAQNQRVQVKIAQIDTFQGTLRFEIQ